MAQELQDALDNYGVSREDILEYGRQKYGDVALSFNFLVLAQLYFKDKYNVSLTFDEYALNAPVRRVSELEEGEWAVIEVIVGDLDRSFEYDGCSYEGCWKRVQDDGTCEKHGYIENPVKYKFAWYFVGDVYGGDDSAIIMKVGPRHADEDWTGKIVRAKGFKTSEGEFDARVIVEGLGGNGGGGSVTMRRRKSTAEPERIGGSTSTSAKPPSPSDQSKPKAMTSSSRGIAMFKQFLQSFGELTRDEVELFIKKHNLNMTVEELVAKVDGAEIDGDKVMLFGQMD